VLEAVSIQKIQLSINKCLIDASSNLLIRDRKADERWAMLLQKQEEKNAYREGARHREEA
jgi:hypothetical protein